MEIIDHETGESFEGECLGFKLTLPPHGSFTCRVRVEAGDSILANKVFLRFDDEEAGPVEFCDVLVAKRQGDVYLMESTGTVATSDIERMSRHEVIMENWDT